MILGLGYNNIVFKNSYGLGTEKGRAYCVMMNASVLYSHVLWEC